MSSRSVIVLLAIALVAPLPLGGATEATRAHPPFHFRSDADFVLLGIPGSGTADDPYRIEGYVFATPMQTAFGVGGLEWTSAAVSFEGTTAHVVVRHNAFIFGVSPPQAQDTPSLVWTPSIVWIDGATNVAIEHNTFDRLGGGIAVVFARDSDVRISDNQFIDNSGRIMELRGSRADVVGNVVESSSAWSALRFEAMPGSSVLGNDVSLGGGVNAAEIYGGPVRIAGNHFANGDVWGDGLSAALAEGSVVEGNDITAGDWCAIAQGSGSIWRDNVLGECGRGLYTPDVDPARIETSNLLDGRAMLQLRGVQGETIDGSGYGWLDARGVSDVTLANFDVSGWTWIVDATGVTITDSTFGDRLRIAATDLTMSRVATREQAIVEVRGTSSFDHLDASGTWFILDVHDGGTALVTDSLFHDTTQDGLRLATEGCGSILVERSTFTNNAFAGVGAYPEACSVFAVHDSSFLGNRYAGAWIKSAGVLDARGNWWGSAEGPNPEGHSAQFRDGALQESGGTILVEPWLAAPPS